MKWSKLLLTCTFMLAITGAVAAQMADTTTPAPAALASSNSEISVSGTVVSSTGTELVIDTDAGQRMTFALDAKTTPATTFTAGERVTVDYHTLSGGTVYHAATIALMPQAEVEPPADEVDQVDEPESETLPNTASSLPLVGLLGLLALGGAVAVRVARP
jgi:hypothetical protein